MTMRVHLQILLLIMTTACSTLYSRGPMAIVESPEVASSDKWRINLNMGLAPVNSVILARDAATRPPIINNPPTLQQDYMSFVGNSLNTPSKLEFGLNADPLATFLSGGIGLSAFSKYQLVGETYDKMQPESHLLGIASHLTYNSQATGGEQQYLFGPGGYGWSAKSNFKGLDLNLSYGFRKNEAWLYYFGYAYEIFNIEGEIHQQKAAGSSTPAATYSIAEAQGFNQKTAVGFVYGKDFFKWNMQAGYLSTQWRQQALNEWCVAMTATFHFGGSGTTAEVKPIDVPKE